MSAASALASRAHVSRSWSKRGRGAAARARSIARVRAAAASPATTPDDGSPTRGPRKPKIAVVGAGWGGFGAAKALCEAGCDVTLLDGIPDPTGATPSTTPSGKPFE